VNETSPHEDHVRITEALFRFGAALPARDDFEQSLYNQWHARDDRRPGFTTYGCAPTSAA
jgi:chromosome condensin MukBEF MukE localization factor